MKYPITAVLIVTLGVAFSVPAQPPAQAPKTFAIQNARVVPVSGPVLERGTVVIRDGLIDAVGVDAAIPSGAWIVEGEGLTVYPGFIDSLSSWGLPNQNGNQNGGGRGGTQGQPQGPGRGGQQERSNSPLDRPATTTWVKAADEFELGEELRHRLHRAGFTTAVVFPQSGIFGGEGSIMSLGEGERRNLVIDPAAGQYLTMNSSGIGYPGSLMGTISYIRQVFLDADHYQTVAEDYAKDPRGKKRPEYDRALDGLIGAKRILLPANRKVEIERMVRFADELGQPTVLYGMREGYRSVDALKAAGLPVLVSLDWPEKPRDPDPEAVETLRTLEDRDQTPTVPGMLAAAGVKFAFYSAGKDQTNDLVDAVKKAIENGLSREDAIRTLTLSPAEIYGVDDRLGSIEPGKIANLTVTRGDAFADGTKVEMVFIDGVQLTPPPEPQRPKPDPAKPEPAKPTPNGIVAEEGPDPTTPAAEPAPNPPAGDPNAKEAVR